MQSQDRGSVPHSHPHSSTNPPAPCTAPATQCFSVQAMADPGTLPRVLEVFAKRGLIPAQVHASRPAGARDGLVVDVHLDNADAEQARLIAQEIRRQFCVDAVLVAEKQAPAHA